MTRAVGIDPGTMSMDICAIEDGKVYYENPLDNVDLASNPEQINDALRETFPVDLIAGPSGYGVEPTRIDEIPERIFEDWYYNYILLTTKEEILKGIEEGIFGAILYKNMTDFSVWLKREQFPVMFIPGVVQLPTVPYYRKLNKLDMGTADKLAVAVLGVHDQSRRFGIPYLDVSFILVEVGFGYNSVIGVEGGRIVDGIGGTNFPGIGYLTLSAVDAELVQLVHNWERKDTFEGGVVSVTGEMDPDAFVSRKDEKNEIAFEAMMEGIEKAVAEMTVSVRKPKEILLSGRWTKRKEIADELTARLSDYAAEVRPLGFLEGAAKTKETAQGYAMVADGLAGGTFKELIEWMQINKAKGTALEYVHHPKLPGPPERFVRFK
ncbi:MAG TPA: DUF1464 family protein [Desulfobacteria bacterium]|nr:DUF1464 family protein [Desulfobacteria bacterium]